MCEQTHNEGMIKIINRLLFRKLINKCALAVCGEDTRWWKCWTSDPCESMANLTELQMHMWIMAHVMAAAQSLISVFTHRW